MSESSSKIVIPEKAKLIELAHASLRKRRSGMFVVTVLTFVTSGLLLLFLMQLPRLTPEAHFGFWLGLPAVVLIPLMVIPRARRVREKLNVYENLVSDIDFTPAHWLLEEGGEILKIEGRGNFSVSNRYVSDAFPEDTKISLPIWFDSKGNPVCILRNPEEIVWLI